MSSISKINTTNINQLPEHLLGESVLPLLLQNEDPSSLHTLSLVCKSWHTAMQKDDTYISYFREKTRGALCFRFGTSAKEEYLRNFPKTLIQKLKNAYIKANLNTTDFESKTLWTVILTHPFLFKHFIEFCDQLFPFNSGPIIGPVLGFFLAHFPPEFSTELDAAPIAIQPNDNNPALLMLSASIYIKFRLYFEGEKTEALDMLLNWFATYTIYSMIHVEGDTLLSKSYRVAKGSLSSLGLLTKVVYLRMKTPVVQLGTFLYDGLFRG